MKKYWTIKDGDKVMRAHVLVYAWEHGMDSIPSGYHVHHKCGNKACLNTEHMELLTEHDHHMEHGKNYSVRVAQIHPKHGVIKIWESQHAAGRAGFLSHGVASACTGYRPMHYDCWWMKLKG